ncbi:uncharacterized protein DUF4159 [Roseivirga ehrenbergii]|uniref:Methyltransferase n=2 Tax=Roseivirga ehrenbergii (strain DSM 102268 / JCM 13514 / KCTC 12282 / NCIMB 14502 / KMM 6017) TaxID=279360 RepID=A0A150XN96_ROSEK|nr:hypothetical protein MB14_16550 [Roseivirga ehrenbergii]TCK99180.1 uncharacterized protein DUF4159 [Roseivirga ehrenbergii]
MDLAIKNMPKDGCVLEIGSYGGHSTCFLLWLLKKHQRQEKLMSCDIWTYEGFDDHMGKTSNWIDGSTEVSRKDYTNYIKQAYINAMMLLSKDNLPHTFEHSSDFFFQSFQKPSALIDVFGQKVKLPCEISFAYIDGDHSYEGVKQDLENLNPYLKKGGFVLFDDSRDGLHFGSAKYMREMLKNKDFKLVDKNPHYLFQKVNLS